MEKYIIAYDISHPKRLYRVSKLVYANSIGGQKSVLEVYLDSFELKQLVLDITKIIKEDDKVNIIPIANHAVLMGKAKNITYDNGVIII